MQKCSDDDSYVAEKLTGMGFPAQVIQFARSELKKQADFDDRETADPLVAFNLDRAQLAVKVTGPRGTAVPAGRDPTDHAIALLMGFLTNGTVGDAPASGAPHGHATVGIALGRELAWLITPAKGGSILNWPHALPPSSFQVHHNCDWVLFYRKLEDVYADRVALMAACPWAFELGAVSAALVGAVPQPLAGKVAVINRLTAREQDVAAMDYFVTS